ncbi:MAG: outer membrane protein assembly factor BamA [Syntrophobacterales bacterium]|nr:outer membrane protein assembly factor BamA [Syntrophobacterales bacterium]
MVKKLLSASLLTIILIFAVQSANAADLKKIALFPFEAHSATAAQGAELWELSYRGITGELAKSKMFTVIPRESLAREIAGKPLNDELIILAGKNSGADYALSGSISEFGDRISVDVKIFDIKTGQAIPGVFVQGRGRKNLDAIIERLNSDIILRLAPEKRIDRVEFKGNRKIEAAAINRGLKSAPGNVLTDEDLSDDIKTIYKLGYFDEVTADVSDTPEGRVITFVVTEKPMISEIRIQGSKQIKKSDIEAVMGVQARQTVNPERLKADINKIKELYDSKGFYNAEISYKIDKAGERDVQVVISVTENGKLFVQDILFEGNRAFTTRELRNMMTTKEWGIFHFFTDSGLLKKEQLRQDIDKLKAFYLNNGFINVQIAEPAVTHDAKGIYIKISVAEGQQYRVGKVEITGDQLAAPRKELLAKLKILKKDFYDRDAVMRDMDYLTQAANDEGYASADILPGTTPREETRTVDVKYEIRKGKLVYFNLINITGNTKTRDKVIRRQLSVVEGDLYSRTKLKNSYMALNNLRYFEEIDFESEKGADETLTNVNIRVKEKQTGMLSLGAGYSAIDKAVVSAQVTQQNLFGRGQTLSLKANVGSSSTLYDISFTEPWLFDRPIWSKFDLWNLYREYDTYNLDTMGFSTTLGYPLWPYVSGYIGYRLAIDNVKDILPTASIYTIRQAGETMSSGLTLTLTRDSTDDVMFPTTGSKNSASVEYTGGPLLGDVSYTRTGVSSTWFFPLPLDTVLGLRGRMGAITGNAGKEIPIYERYYLGGIDSLRGLREVGPVDPATGEVIGGVSMLNFNVDYTFPLIKKAGMRGVVFFDTGNTWESGYHVTDMRKTAGLGIRWYSPIGPLRLEWGYVLDKKENESPSRWEFTIGMFM